MDCEGGTKEAYYIAEIAEICNMAKEGWERDRRRMGMGQKKDGKGAEEGWERDKTRMGMKQKKMGK